MGHIARLRLICDRFVAGHDSCALRRHLDNSVAPETPIRDIVDRCWVWESHSDTEARRFSKPGPERALPINTVGEPEFGLDDRMVVTVTIPPAGPNQLVTAFTGGSAGTEAHSAFQNWNYRHGDFVAKPASGDTSSSLADATVSHMSGLCNGGVFLCSKAGHGVSRCPELK